MVQSLRRSQSFRILFNSPELVEEQRSGFHHFLKHGIAEELSKISFLEVKKQNVDIEVFLEASTFQLIAPDDNSRNCIIKMKTYACKLYVQIRIVWRKKSGDILTQTEPEWVLLAHLPMMTKRGHFVINGSPRVIVHQVVRAPGVYFQKFRKVKKDERNKARFYGDIIPRKGVWVRLQISKTGQVEIKLKKSTKVQAEMVERCLAVIEKQELATERTFQTEPLLGLGAKGAKVVLAKQRKKDNKNYLPRSQSLAITGIFKTLVNQPTIAAGYSSKASTPSARDVASKQTRTFVVRCHPLNVEKVPFDNLWPIKTGAYPERRAPWSCLQTRRVCTQIEDLQAKRSRREHSLDRPSGRLKLRSATTAPAGMLGEGEHALTPTRLHASFRRARINFFTQALLGHEADSKNGRSFTNEQPHGSEMAARLAGPCLQITASAQPTAEQEVDRSEGSNLQAKRSMTNRAGKYLSKKFTKAVLKGDDRAFTNVYDNLYRVPEMKELEDKMSPKGCYFPIDTEFKRDFSYKHIFATFKAPWRYSLGQVGRHKLNKKFGLDLTANQLTSLDIQAARNWLYRLRDGKEIVDDIDHSQNRRVRQSGELIQNQFENGVTRLRKLIRRKLKTPTFESLPFKKPTVDVSRQTKLGLAKQNLESEPVTINRPTGVLSDNRPGRSEILLSDNSALALANLRFASAHQNRRERVLGFTEQPNEATLGYRSSARLSYDMTAVGLTSTKALVRARTPQEQAPDTSGFVKLTRSVGLKLGPLQNRRFCTQLVADDMGRPGGSNLQRTMSSADSVPGLPSTPINGAIRSPQFNKGVDVLTKLVDCSPLAPRKRSGFANRRLESTVLSVLATAQRSSEVASTDKTVGFVRELLKKSTLFSRINLWKIRENLCFSTLDNPQQIPQWQERVNSKQTPFHSFIPRLRLTDSRGLLGKTGLQKRTAIQSNRTEPAYAEQGSVAPYSQLIRKTEQNVDLPTNLRVASQAEPSRQGAVLPSKEQFLTGPSVGFRPFHGKPLVRTEYQAIQTDVDHADGLTSATHSFRPQKFSILCAIERSFNKTAPLVALVYAASCSASLTNPRLAAAPCLQIFELQARRSMAGKNKSKHSIVHTNLSPTNLRTSGHKTDGFVRPRLPRVNNTGSRTHERVSARTGQQGTSMPQVLGGRVLKTPPVGLSKIQGVSSVQHQGVAQPTAVQPTQFTKSISLNRTFKQASELFSTKPINGALREFFGSNPLSQYMDQTNPLAEVTHKRRISSLGIGGVSRESAGMAIRGIHPTHYGRICPIETPEGKNAGLVNSLALYAKINKHGFIETPYYKVIKGQVQQELGFSFYSALKETVQRLHLAPSDLQQSQANMIGVLDSAVTNSTPLLPGLAQPTAEQVASAQLRQGGLQIEDLQATEPSGAEELPLATSKASSEQEPSFVRLQSGNSAVPLATPFVRGDSGCLVPVRVADTLLDVFKKVSPYEVDCMGISPVQILSVATSLIPFLEHNDANRALMGSNMQRQAVPLMISERPIVGTGLEALIAAESGQLIQSSTSGLVSHVSANKIIIERLFNTPKAEPYLQLTASAEPTVVQAVGRPEGSNLQAKRSMVGLEPKNLRSVVQEKTASKIQAKPDFASQRGVRVHSSPRGHKVRSSVCLQTQGYSSGHNSRTLHSKAESEAAIALAVLKKGQMRQMPAKRSCARLLRASANGLHSGAVQGSRIAIALSKQRVLIYQNLSLAQLRWTGGFVKTKLSFAETKQRKLQYLTTLHRTESLLSLAAQQSQARATPQIWFNSINQAELGCSTSFAAIRSVPITNRPMLSKPDGLLSKGGSSTKRTGALKNPRMSERSSALPSPCKSSICTRSLRLRSRLLTNPQGLLHSGAVQANRRFASEGVLTKAALKFAKPEVLQGGLDLKQSKWSTLRLAQPTAVQPGLLPGSLTQRSYVGGFGQHQFSETFQQRTLLPFVHSLRSFSRSNQETCLTQKPVVHEGEWVQKGEILTDCSASEKGELAVGKNVLIAYLPWEGYNFEDAIVVSDRLTKEQIYASLHIERYVCEAQDIKEKITNSNEWFTRNLPGVPPKLVSHLDTFGFPKIGTILKEGDILVGKMRYFRNKPTTPYEKLLSDILGDGHFSVSLTSLRVPKGVHEARVISHRVVKTFRSSLETTFTGVSRPAGTPKMVHIFLGEKRSIQIGDKMSGRHGNKGIISTILPKQDMPYLPDGSPIDILLNPLGVPSRMNVGQIFESLLGLASTYLNQNFKITAFDELYGVEASQSLVYLKLYQARLQSGQNWLFQINFPGKTRLIDGRSGECFDQWVTVGRAYMLKLIHMVNEKIHARNTGPYALITQQPLRGRSQKGGQRLGEMEVWALEGYGAAYILQELLTKKSDDFAGRQEIINSLVVRSDKFSSIDNPYRDYSNPDDPYQRFSDPDNPYQVIQETRLVLGHPEIFKTLICELQALCLDVGVYALKKESFQREYLGIVN